MKVEFGGGNISVVLDLRNQQIRYYESGSVDEFHAALMGETYYRSRSGASGAGNIPDRPWLRAAGTYRTDCGPSHGLSFAQVLPGIEVSIPYSYRESNPVYGERWPAILRNSDGTLDFVHPLSLFKRLLERVEMCADSFEFAFYPVVPGEIQRINVVYRREVGRSLRYKDALRRVYYRETLWRAAPECTSESSNFWGGLGFDIVTSPEKTRWLVRRRQGMATQVIPYDSVIAPLDSSIVSDISAPHFPLPSSSLLAYVQERDGSFVARALRDGVETERILEDSAEIMEVFANPLQITTTLNSSLPAMTLANWVNLNPDLIVSIRDSVDAGNCEDGSRRFVQDHFNGDVVRLSRLNEFAQSPEVLKVIVHLWKKHCVNP